MYRNLFTRGSPISSIKRPKACYALHDAVLNTILTDGLRKKKSPQTTPPSAYPAYNIDKTNQISSAFQTGFNG